jgi:hypothetical protein
MQREVEDRQRTVRMSMQLLRRHAFDLVRRLLAGKARRGRVLDFLGHAINHNRKRTQTWSNFPVHSSDAFMVNVFLVCVELCRPIFEGEPNKLDKVDVRYLLHPKRRFSIDDETRLAAADCQRITWIDPRNASREETFQASLKQRMVAVRGGDDEESEKLAAVEPTFTTEIFFITVALAQFGLVPLFHKMEQCAKSVREAQERLKLVQSGGALPRQVPGVPHPVLETEAQAQAELDMRVRNMLAMETILTDPAFLNNCSAFLSHAGDWLLKQADPNGNGPPLERSVSAGFASLPEYYLGSVVSFFCMIPKCVCGGCLLVARAHGVTFGRFAAQSMQSVDMQRILRVIVTFMTSDGHVMNPYLRAQLVEV